MIDKSKGVCEFIMHLSFLLDYSNKIYLSYLNSNKKFMYAKILYSVNSKIITLLNSFSYLLSENDKKDELELLFHLDVWSSLWERKFEQQQPKLFDPFFLKNSVNFPKVSVKRLLCCKNFVAK